MVGTVAPQRNRWLGQEGQPMVTDGLMGANEKEGGRERHDEKEDKRKNITSLF